MSFYEELKLLRATSLEKKAIEYKEAAKHRVEVIKREMRKQAMEHPDIMVITFQEKDNGNLDYLIKEIEGEGLKVIILPSISFGYKLVRIEMP